MFVLKRYRGTETQGSSSSSCGAALRSVLGALSTVRDLLRQNVLLPMAFPSHRDVPANVTEP